MWMLRDDWRDGEADRRNKPLRLAVSSTRPLMQDKVDGKHNTYVECHDASASSLHPFNEEKLL